MGPESQAIWKPWEVSISSPTMNFDLTVMKGGEESHKGEPQLAWTGLRKGGLVAITRGKPS